MDDAVLMGFCESQGDIDGEIESRIDRKRPAINLRSERFSLVVLHHDEHLSAWRGVRLDGVERSFIDVVNHADVVVLEGGSRLGFMDESLLGFGVSGEVRREELQRDNPLEARVLCLVDNAHSPASKLLEDSIMGNGRADHQDLGNRKGWAEEKLCGKDRREQGHCQMSHMVSMRGHLGEPPTVPARLRGNEYYVMGNPGVPTNGR